MIKFGIKVVFSHMWIASVNDLMYNKKENEGWQRFVWGLLQDSRNCRFNVCRLWGEDGKSGIEERKSRGRFSIYPLEWIFIFFIIFSSFKWGDQLESSSREWWIEDIFTRRKGGEEDITTSVTSRRRGLGRIEVKWRNSETIITYFIIDSSGKQCWSFSNLISTWHYFYWKSGDTHFRN